MSHTYYNTPIYSYKLYRQYYNSFKDAKDVTDKTLLPILATGYVPFGCTVDELIDTYSCGLFIIPCPHTVECIEEINDLVIAGHKCDAKCLFDSTLAHQPQVFAYSASLLLSHLGSGVLSTITYCPIDVSTSP